MVTRPGLFGCLYWRWLPRVFTLRHPSASTCLIRSRTFMKVTVGARQTTRGDGLSHRCRCVDRPRKAMVCPTSTEDGADAGDSDGEIVVAEEGGASALSGAGEEAGIGGEAFEERDEAPGIARGDLPSTVEALNDEGRGGFAGTDVENGAAGGHEAVGFAGDDGAEGFGFLGDEADVAGAEGGGELAAGAIAGEFDVSGEDVGRRKRLPH